MVSETKALEITPRLCGGCEEYYSSLEHSEQSKNDFTLVRSGAMGHPECVKACLNAGADVNTADVDKLECEGVTVLSEAAADGQYECVKLLIAAGADVNRQNESGYTALMFASWNCVRLLLEAGADVNKQNAEGTTALMFAAESGSCERVKALLQSGADVNIQHNDDLNALTTYLTEWSQTHSDDQKKQIVMLLFAAGETIDEGRVEAPDYLKPELNLKHLCREAIRKHLINIDLHQHLFGRIPQLGLPGYITAYLLYNMSLDDDGM